MDEMMEPRRIISHEFVRIYWRLVELSLIFRYTQAYEASIDPLFKRCGRLVRPQPNKRSVLPGARYPTKDVAGDRHMADGRERQVSGHQRLTVRRQLPQK